MNPHEYQVLAARTECNQHESSKRYVIGNIADLEHGLPSLLSTRLNHAALGLAGEAGELCGAVERWLHYGKEFDKANVVEEIGDALWYLALACNALAINMETVMQTNIEKLRKRYPEKYSDYKAAEENRNRQAEREVLEQAIATKDPEPKQESFKELVNRVCTNPLRYGGASNVPDLEFPTDSMVLQSVAKLLQKKDQADFHEWVPGRLRRIADFVESQIKHGHTSKIVEQFANAYSEQDSSHQDSSLKEPDEAMWNMAIACNASESNAERFIPDPKYLKPLNPDYPVRCRICHVNPVSKMSQTGRCPDCGQEERAKAARLAEGFSFRM